MTTVRHLNCGTLQARDRPKAACHCLLLEGEGGLALVDTGIGLKDVADPDGRIGRPAIEAAGFQFVEAETALRQVERLGHRADDVKHVVLTHADPDHAGGLADFPDARVHLSAEELDHIKARPDRYRPPQFAHGPRWTPYPGSTRRWYGLEARPLDLGFDEEVLLVPLFGHTLGHSGVAVRQGDRWLLHVGDAYYLRAELTTDDHPVSQLAALRADDDALRRATLDRVRQVFRQAGDEVDMVGYHDFGEFPR